MRQVASPHPQTPARPSVGVRLLGGLAGLWRRARAPWDLAPAAVSSGQLDGLRCAWPLGLAMQACASWALFEWPAAGEQRVGHGWVSVAQALGPLPAVATVVAPLAATGLVGSVLLALGAPGSLRRQWRGLQAAAAAQGLAWSLVAALVLHRAGPSAGMAVFMLNGALLAAMGLAWGPCPAAYLSYACCAGLPMVGVLTWGWGASSPACVLALAALVALQRRWMRQRGQALRLASASALENQVLRERLQAQSQGVQQAWGQAQQAKQAAEDANRAKTVFLASASHDLRQPLHAAGLYLAALSRSGLNPRQQHLLKQVRASADAANELLDTLLDFSKVDAGVVKPVARDFPLQAVFHRLERELAPVAEAKGLVFRLRDSVHQAHADPALVEMILRNLLVNAIRYTERGGVLLACRQRQGRLWVEVWDTGVGIAKDQHGEIFREFHQLAQTHSERHQGLGLGLAIVQGLARVMQLSISLDSRPHKGSVFRLGLPFGQGALAPPRPQAASANLSGLRVLVVDDEPAVLTATTQLLQAWGCECQAYASAQDALAALPYFRADVALIDHRLPGELTGEALVLRLRAASGRSLPAWIITGDTAAHQLRQAQTSGLQWLHKPLSAERLHAALCQQQMSAAGAGAAGPQAQSQADPDPDPKPGLRSDLGVSPANSG